MNDFKIEVLSKENCKAELKIELPAEAVEKELEKVFAEIQQNAVISGFRKGKAPMDFVKKEFTKTATEKTIRNIMTEGTESVLKAGKYNPVTVPQAEPVSYEPGKPFVFSLRIEESPEFELKDYKKLKVTKKIKNVTDKEIDDVIKNLQDRQSTLVDAGDVPVEKHHFLIADYESTIDGKKVGNVARDQMIDLSHESLPAGFCEALVGSKIGESKSIETKVADKQAKFDVSIKSIKKKQFPAVDDEFAKDMGCDTIAHLREKIKDELKKEEERKSRAGMENEIMDTLLKENEFPVPPSLLEDEIVRLTEKAKQYLVNRRSYNEEEFKKSLPAMNEKFSKDAEKTVRISYIFSKIAEIEKISVSDQDVDKKIMEMAGGDKAAETNYRKYTEYIMLQLKEEKIFDFLISNAKVKEAVQ